MGLGHRALTRAQGTAAAVGRSLRIYHGDVGRAGAMDRLYARFVRSGSLAYDIGAHVGDRVSSFRRLGARVVAVEPQPGPARAIRLIHGRDPGVTVLEQAVGDRAGVVTILVNAANPTVSTVSDAFVHAARDAAGWEGQSWDGRLAVPCTTLDALVARHGRPAFAKIDVEGYEDRVLLGLSTPLPALSFEFTTIARPVAARCLARLLQLGPYRFDVALGETQRLEFKHWISGDEIAAYLDALPEEANSGDVYAVLTGTGPAGAGWVGPTE